VHADIAYTQAGALALAWIDNPSVIARLMTGREHNLKGPSVLPQQERVNIAVFIDFDNIEIGVKNTLGEHFDIGIILEALKERGEVVTKIAYADWTRAGEYSRNLTQHAIRLVQRNLTPGGDKNGADINLALDALEMAFTHPHINAYVIVGGDSDFLSLVEKLKQYDKKVFVVGGRSFTSVILQRNCHEFIAYENLIRKPVARGGRPVPSVASSPVAQAFPIVRRALKILADREVTPQTGLLKSTLLQLDSTFSERNYGASSFLDFTEKLAQAGLVQLKHSGRSVIVELNGGFEDTDAPSAELKVQSAADDARPADGRAADGAAHGEQISRPMPVHHNGGEQRPPVEVVGDNTEGVRVVGELLRAATNARWPMYLRNVKQVLRAANFDERSYGFGGLMDLLRACQRDGLLRVERDRRRGLRVFQGTAIGLSVASRSEGAPPGTLQDEPRIADVVDFPESMEAADNIGNVDMRGGDHHVDVHDAQPAMVIDTTAELLGRAKPRRPRARAAAVASAAPRRVTKKAAAPARRTSRARKSTGHAKDE
jgi:uncharacterized LabA/DUF88 family protein